MMNEGLEALATLASKSPSSSANTAGGPPHNSSQKANESPFFAQHGSNENTPACTSSGSASAAPAGTHLPPSTFNFVQTLQNRNVSQWQHAPQQGGSGTNPSVLSNSNFALLMGMQQQQSNPYPQSDQLAFLQRQLSCYHYNMNNQSGNQLASGIAGQAVQHQANTASLEPHQALALSQALQAYQRVPHNNGSQTSGTNTQHQVLPLTASKARTSDIISSASTGSNSMPPPMPAHAAPIVVSTMGVPSPHRRAKIVPQPFMDGSVIDKDKSHFEQHTHGKKSQKRAANRKSAQLSRKRRKEYIDELHEENNDLRRKDQILRAIPDLIVVFDSAGKLWFVSESVSMFLGMAANELEGTSFWDRLCEDSVRLVKAAFMDSLAAREPDSDTVPLGARVWELRLFDKDGNHKIVTLNGVVHFAGDRPECVCSIRPKGDKAVDAKASSKAGGAVKEPKAFTVRHHVKPHQSVVSNLIPDSLTRKHKRQAVTGVKGREIVRISDSGNSSSGDSETGSSDGMIPSS